MNHTAQEIAQALLIADKPDELLAVYRMALESHDTPMVVLTLDESICYLNSAAAALIGVRNPAKLVNKSAQEAGLPWHVDGTSVLDRLNKGETDTYFVLKGQNYVCEAMLLHDRLGNQVGVLEILRPEGGHVSSNGIDKLTGLLDRERFCAETRRLIDYHPNKAYSLIYWNVVRFNTINHVFSSATGDEVLRSIANTIRSFATDVGTCGRIDNDHFVICVPTELVSYKWLAEQSEGMIISDTAAYTYNSSYGVYHVTDRALTVSDMCSRAALAQKSISESDRVGGTCYAIYDEKMGERDREDQDLIATLSFAIEEHQIVPYFQPLYDIKTGQIISAEALVRWEHPERGLIPPFRFVRLFERNGMITGLDRHIWDCVGTFLEERITAGKKVVPVSINVSRVDFFSPTLVDELNDIVERHRLPKELLRIEITESAYSDDPARIRDIIKTLRANGFTVLIDDFGSGYSSLNTLKDITIDILKLDMEFLRNLEESDRAACIVSHMVSMAHDLGLKTVAEGVETQDHVEFLRGVGCDIAQGYFYSRPIPQAEFTALLDADEAKIIAADKGADAGEDALAQDAVADKTADADKPADEDESAAQV